MAEKSRVGRRFRVLLALGVLAAATAAAQPQPPETAAPASEEALRTDLDGRFGGRLVVALRNEPETFNPALATDVASATVAGIVHADLVHIDRATQRVVPVLASTWTVSEDGLRIRLALRRGLRFSDGEPFDADDVVFTFAVYLDEAVGSPNRQLLMIGEQPIAVRKIDPYAVEVELAEPYAVGVRLFDSIPILPEHRLAAAWREGRFPEVWGTGTAPAEIVGLGPFRIARYQPGERLELERNPHYWKLDRQGRRLPYLDQLTVLFVPSVEAQALRFQNGETQVIDGLSTDAFAELERDQDRRGYSLRDLGPGLDYHFLFFNLNDLAGKDLPEVAAKQAWFREKAFRQAVSRAIDRRGIVKTVFAGRATPLATHVTPANQLWRNPRLEPAERSPEAALALLAGAGFRRDENGTLRDAGGHAVAFSILINSGNRIRLDMATVIQNDLRALGMDVKVATLEFGSLLDRIFESYDYEAGLLALGGGDVDPNPDMNVLHSGGNNRLWDLGPAPRTDWEKRIDELMERQLVALDPALRRRLYDEVQALVAENLPFVPLVSPHVLVGARRDLGNFKPAILRHPTLWNVEELYWRSSPADGR